MQPERPSAATSRRHQLRDVTVNDSTHAGLWLDRYLTMPTNVVPGEDDEAKTARSELIRQATERIKTPVGYRAAAQKRLALLEQDSPGVRREIREYATSGRTIVGLGQKGVIEAGITLDRTWGVPLLPGSSLKGLAAAVAHGLTDDERWRKNTDGKAEGDYARALFGTTDQRGVVTFHDAFWLPSHDQQPALAQDIMTVHHPSYYQKKPDDREFHPPDGTDSPIPVSFITTRAGLTFVITLEAREDDAAWLKPAWQLLEAGLERLGIGAKTNAGYGRLVKDEKRAEQRERDAAARRTQDQLRQGDHVGRMAMLVANEQPQLLYEALRRLAETPNPYDCFQSATRADVPAADLATDDAQRDAARSGLLEALKADKRWAPALREGKGLPGVQPGAGKLRELGEQLLGKPEPGDVSYRESDRANDQKLYVDVSWVTKLEPNQQALIRQLRTNKRHFNRDRIIQVVELALAGDEQTGPDNAEFCKRLRVVLQAWSTGKTSRELGKVFERSDSTVEGWIKALKARETS